MAAPAATTTTVSSATPATNLSGTPVSQLSVGAPPATPSTPPNFSSVNSTNLQPTTPVQLPPPPPPNTTQANGIVAGAQQTSKSVQDYINQLTPTQTGPAAQANQSILDQIAQLTGEDTGKDQALLDAEKATGATQDQADLTALNNQLLTKTAQYNNEQANLGGNNSVETSAVLAAQNAGLTKARAADIGVTTAQIQAKQGNLTLAMNTAQQAVDAKYSTIEDNIKTAQAQLAAVAPLLSQEEKTQSDAQAQVLKDQADAVAQQKADETAVQNVALEAAKAGASPDVLATIQNSPDVISAIAAAAPALGAAAANTLQQQAFDNNIKLQDLMIQKADLSLRQQQQAEADNLTPANLIAYAQQYAATGTEPAGAPKGSLGAISQVAGALPKAPGTIYDASTGVAAPKINAQQENDISGLYNIINNVLPQLSNNYSPKVGTAGGSPLIANVNDYNNTYNDLKTAITSLSSAGILKGSAATLISQIPDASHWYSSGIYTTQGKNQITDLTNTLTQSLNSYLSANNLKLAGFNDINSSGSSGNLNQFFKP